MVLPTHASIVRKRRPARVRVSEREPGLRRMSPKRWRARHRTWLNCMSVNCNDSRMSRARLLLQVEPFQHFTVALHGQMIHQIAHVLRELLVVETLFQRQRLVLEVGQQLTIIVVAMGQLPAPVGGRELACRAIQIASEIARVIQSLSANLLDRLQKRAL